MISKKLLDIDPVKSLINWNVVTFKSLIKLDEFLKLDVVKKFKS